VADVAAADGSDVSKFEKVGAMRAGFETYRAFRQDTSDLQAALKDRGKLNLPVLLLAGEASTFIPVSQTVYLESPYSSFGSL
jgi:pimeloyl-ACP methyl ester carboxylesterase